MEACTSLINGSWLPPSRVVCNPNPGDLDRTGSCYSEATGAEAGEAMDAARNAFPSWRARPAADRIGRLRQWLDAIETREETFAGTITRENGKTLGESAAEVRAALQDGRFLLDRAAGEAEESGPREKAWVDFSPLGVFLIITPWNFPLATLLRKMVPALAYGNTVVVKPSEFTPGAAHLAFQCLDLPVRDGGIANLVLGTGNTVGPPLVDHPALCGISFTGSTRAGHAIQLQTAGRQVRLQLEMGGKNALLVLADADLESAAEAACTGAFSCAGQWCTGTSRVVVEKPAVADFTSLLLEKVRALRVGPGHRADTTMGPVAHHAHFRQVVQAIDTARTEGAECLIGGDTIAGVEGCRGYFIEPTLFGRVLESHTLFREEIFGPVLALVEADSPAHAVELANASPYGLSASIFTRDREKALAAIDGIEAGICHWNLHTAYRTPDLPVCGWKESGRGLPECGSYGRAFYTRPKAVYLNP